tara:strand:+ start:465 stop:803 length:339 start_codon:yes stop_codon:yes gene_type:complete
LYISDHFIVRQTIIEVIIENKIEIAKTPPSVAYLQLLNSLSNNLYQSVSSLIILQYNHWKCEKKILYMKVKIERLRVPYKYKSPIDNKFLKFSYFTNLNLQTSKLNIKKGSG